MPPSKTTVDNSEHPSGTRSSASSSSGVKTASNRSVLTHLAKSGRAARVAHSVGHCFCGEWIRTSEKRRACATVRQAGETRAQVRRIEYGDAIESSKSSLAETIDCLSRRVKVPVEAAKTRMRSRISFGSRLAVMSTVPLPVLRSLSSCKSRDWEGGETEGVWSCGAAS